MGASSVSKLDKFKRLKRLLKCNHCRPHRGENIGRKPKYGNRKKRRHYENFIQTAGRELLIYGKTFVRIDEDGKYFNVSMME